MIPTAFVPWYAYRVTKAVFSFLRGRKRLVLGVLTALLAYGAVWATFGGFAHAGPPISASSRREVLRGSEPVVDAIRHYKKDNRYPPQALTELVPRYLPRLPRPPVAICRGSDYLYKAEAKQWSIGVPVRDERDGVLTYSSTGKYPPGKPGMSVERIGDWAYYHGNPY